MKQSPDRNDLSTSQKQIPSEEHTRGFLSIEQMYVVLPPPQTRDKCSPKQQSKCELSFS